MRTAVGETTYRIWLEVLEAVELSGDALVVSAPESKRPWIADRYSRLLQACAATVLGPEVQVELVGGGRRGREAGGGLPPGGEVNPKYTFDQFVIGDGNRLAHAAALAVAEQPGQAYNPLLLCGPPGLGKTHLLHSIANYLCAFSPELDVRYATVEGFTNGFLAALQNRALDHFKERYRSCDVLLIDDVQFLAAKARTEEEFFHTFNSVYETGSQLVLTSDRPPRDIEALEARLRERFEAGLVADVAPPDFSTRLTILRKRAQHDGVGVAEEALELIAAQVANNVRALEGALIRVVAFASLMGRPVSAALAQEVIASLYPVSERRTTLPEIQRRTCEVFGVTIEELVSPSRAARVARPRQIAMFLARELTDHTLPAIGREFGGRNHATVLHACQRAREQIATDKDTYEAVSRLTAELRSTR